MSEVAKIVGNIECEPNIQGEFCNPAGFGFSVLEVTENQTKINKDKNIQNYGTRGPAPCTSTIHCGANPNFHLGTFSLSHSLMTMGE